MNTNLKTLLLQVIPGLGYDLVNIEIAPAKIIRIFIDKPDGVTVDDCEKVSNHLSKLFVVENIDFNRLEVSSPGIERELYKIQDFIIFKSKLAKIKTINVVNDQKVFQGIIADVIDNQIILNIKTQECIIEFNNISKARLVFDYKLKQ